VCAGHKWTRPWLGSFWLGWKSRSKKGLAVSVLCYNQRMDKGKLDCDISITCYCIKTAITIISNWAFKLGSKIKLLTNIRYYYNLKAMKFLFPYLH
jgi:hypothetical protein